MASPELIILSDDEHVGERIKIDNRAQHVRIKSQTIPSPANGEDSSNGSATASIFNEKPLTIESILQNPSTSTTASSSSQMQVQFLK